MLHVSIQRFETIVPLADFRQFGLADSFRYRQQPIED
nr:MAG TPA: hypothetical protein [Caudoviricetes sp.]